MAVELLMESNYAEPAPFSLLDLQKGQTAKIKGIVGNLEAFGPLDDAVTQRLKDFGFLVGHDITLIGYGFLGKDPIAVKIGSSQFALRQAEAVKVQLEITTE